MWMMVICCLLPIVVLFGGTAFFRSIGYNWIGIGLAGIFLIIHFSKMWRSKRGHDSKDHNSCCH
ncbi:hypothetical protein D4R51_02275 [bacterium]|nr:MAG: hypothetical protein D4R51_02275 [bacterium]